jgi:steroid 5-alpha reductase family enzyme
LFIEFVREVNESFQNLGILPGQIMEDLKKQASNQSRRRTGRIICLLAYIMAGLMVWMVYDAVSIFHPILVVLVLDVLATLTVFLFSVAFNNSSMYDPYWSVVPPVIVFFWLVKQMPPAEFMLLHWIILSLVLIWSVRLTLNWLIRWRGIRDEDWRYITFRFKYKEYYWMVSLFGIHLFPTLIVLLGCLAVYPALALGDGELGIMEGTAAAVTLSGILIEGVADWQLRKYICDKSKCDFLSTGLWKYSRHPNYFGEVLFWIGLFLFSTGLPEIYWWIVPGPVLMILMFYTISIPMIDKRMIRRKTGYRDYYKRTSALIPWPPLRKPEGNFTRSG